MKYPFDDNEENRSNPELCIAKSFSLRRRVIAAIRARAKALNISMSTYVATLIHNDLVRGVNAPLSLEPAATVGTGQPPPRGVVVPGFDLEAD